MKILAIRLKNLASLAGEQVIDFTAEPLASAGLFAITGPTGAGKSTILDALCLALFGSTPRLDSVSPLNKVPEVDAEIGGGDERNLLRRGCGSGYAEVDFVGVDGHRYRARWEVKRAREKIDGRLQASSQSLTDLDSGTPGQRQETRIQGTARSPPWADPGPVHPRRAAGAERIFRLPQGRRQRARHPPGKAHRYRPLQPPRPGRLRGRQGGEGRPRPSGAAGRRPATTGARAARGSGERTSGSARRTESAAAAAQALEAQRQWLSELQRPENEREAACQQLQDAEDERENLAEARRILDLFEQLAPQRHRFLRLQDLGPLLDKAADSLARLQHEEQAVQQRLAELQSQCSAASEQLRSAEQARQTPSRGSSGRAVKKNACSI